MAVIFGEGGGPGATSWPSLCHGSDRPLPDGLEHGTSQRRGSSDHCVRRWVATRSRLDDDLDQGSVAGEASFCHRCGDTGYNLA